jgi:hypothetical protein
VGDPSRADVALFFKHLKLAGLGVTATVTWGLVFFSIGLWAWRRFNAPRV